MTGAIVTSEAEIAEIVRAMRTIGVVGAKSDRTPEAPAHWVPAQLQSMGLRVLPINPTIDAALGMPTFPDVASVGERVDVLDVFRRIPALPELADQILALPADRRPGVVWFQLGIRDDAVAARLSAAGMRVVQDHCLGVAASEYRR